MTTLLVTYATRAHLLNQKRLNRSAMCHGVDHTISWNDRRLKKTSFYREHRHILDSPTGAGYWLWKPFIILDALEKANPLDIIIYCDTDLMVIEDIGPFIQLCTEENPILLIANHGNLNKDWTKRDCFILMGCDEERYHEVEQVLAGFQVYRNVEKSRRFVRDYLRYCCDERILTDMSNRCGCCNFDSFVEHRRDQSVLSLLAEKERTIRFRDPTEWGNHLKMNDFRKAGEWLKSPCSETPFTNSNYGTILSAMQPFLRSRWRLFIADAARQLRIR